MAAITVRNLEEGVKEQLKERAVRNGRSLEAEARMLLGDAVAEQKAQQEVWGTRIATRAAKYQLKESELWRPDDGKKAPETFDE